MTVTGQHGQAGLLPKMTCSMLPNCNIEFLDTQVTGAVFMVMKTFGEWPIPSNPDIAAKVKCVATHGGMIVDTMGLGKTYLALLYLSFLAVHSPPRQWFKPSLILAPSGVVLQQWVDAIYRHFPDLRLIVAHGEKSIDPKVANTWVSAAAMKKAPSNLTLWPRHLQYIFDKTDRNAAATVVISTYETFASRTIEQSEVARPGKKPKVQYNSKWPDVFGTLLLDEGHKLRHYWTRIYAAVKGLNADVHWFLTATPVVNSSLVGSILSYRYEMRRR